MTSTSPIRRTVPRLRSFVDRHVGPDEAQQAQMLKALGFDSLDQLMAAAVPGGIRAAGALDLPSPVDEEQAAAELRALAGRNHALEPMIGLGYHGTVTPGRRPPQRARGPRPGTPPTRRTSRRSRRAGSRRC